MHDDLIKVFSSQLPILANKGAAVFWSARPIAFAPTSFFFSVSILSSGSIANPI